VSIVRERECGAAKRSRKPHRRRGLIQEITHMGFESLEERTGELFEKYHNGGKRVVSIKSVRKGTYVKRFEADHEN